MGRVTIFGKQIVADKYNKLVGINLGYNMVEEHDEGYFNIPSQNARAIYYLTQAQQSRGLKSALQTKKDDKKVKNLVKRWECTPYKDFVFDPRTESLLRMIVIDNTKYRRANYLLEDGRYYLLSIGYGLNAESWNKHFGMKKTMSEDVLYSISDVQSSFLSKEQIRQDSNFLAIWGKDDPHLIIVLPEEQKSYLEDIQEALKEGRLACVSSEPRLFKQRGCCLIDLDRAYFSRK